MRTSDNENEKTNSARSLWCRLIDGAELSSEEDTAIRNTLESNARLREEWDTDATMHALLRSVQDLKKSEDGFVRAVMARCLAESSESVEPAATDDTVLPELASVAGAPPRFTGGAFTWSGGHRRRERRPFGAGWRSMTAIAMLFVGVGILGWWFATSGSTPTTGSGSASTGPVTLPSRQPNGSGERTSIAQMAPDSGDAVTSNAPENEVTVKKSRSSTNVAESMKNGRAAEVVTKDVAPPSSTFVTLTKIEDAVWERSWAEGDRVGDHVVRLFGGRVELSFDGGAKVTLEGPIEFRPLTSGQLELRRGRLVAAVPKQAIGFTVSTPTSTVVDLGTEFEVFVRETGASDVVVTKGEIEVMPTIAEGRVPRKWRLVPNGLNQASFFERTGDEETGPVSAAIRGTDGAFQGMISMSGRTADFTSAEAFDDVRERLVQQFEQSQQETLQQWTEFVESMHKNVQGTMQLNGAEVQFGNFEDVLRLQRQMLDRTQIPGGEPVNFPESSFTGSINVNGKIIQFRTREEYESARRSAFGAAANFGAGDFLERRKPTTRKSTRSNMP